MPSQFTIQQIIERAAAAADMHDNFVTPEQWLAWAAVEFKGLDIFLARLGIRTGQSVQMADNSVNADRIPVSTNWDLLAVIGVWEVRDSRYRQLRYRDMPDFGRPFADQTNDTTLTGPAREWWVDTDKNLIYLSPIPATGSYAAAFLKTQVPTVGFELNDVVQYPMGLEEIVVLRLARRAVLKEESDPSGIERQLRDEEAKAEQYASSVSLAGQHAVRNVDRVERGWSTWQDPFSLYVRDSWFWI